MTATPISGGVITTTDTTSPVPFNIDVGSAVADRLLLIAINGKDNESVSGITVAGSAMTRIDGATLNGSLRLYAFDVPSGSSGSQSCAATLSDSFGTGLISWGLFGDTDPAGRYGTSWNASGTGTTQTSGSQTCPSGAVLFGALWHQGGESAATITSGTAFGNGYDGSNGRAFSSAYRSDTGALAWTAGYSLPWSIVGVAVLGAASAPIITGDQGSYSLTGQDASLKTTRILTAAQGSYSLSGQDVTLTYTQPGAYTLTASQGSYAIVGSDGLAQRAMNAAFGSYSLSGQAASFSSGVPQAYTLTASQGAYALTGRSARLLWSNAPITLSSGHSISISISMGVS